jgi:predicted LPLAT superfamily acyltransferase
MDRHASWQTRVTVGSYSCRGLFLSILTASAERLKKIPVKNTWTSKWPACCIPALVCFCCGYFGQDLFVEWPAGFIGMFLMGAHMGSFESVRSIARHHPALKMVLLMYEENAQNIKQLLKAINPDAQQDIIALGRPGAMLEVKEKLAQGALIGVLADRSFEDSGNTDVNFLGTKAALPLGPFRMAAMLRHPIYFMVGIYQGGRKYNIHIEAIMDFSDPKIDREQAAQLAMARYVELLEKYCRLAPYNWFNFFDFWQENSNPS